MHGTSGSRKIQAPQGCVFAGPGKHTFESPSYMSYRHGPYPKHQFVNLNTYQHPPTFLKWSFSTGKHDHHQIGVAEGDLSMIGTSRATVKAGELLAIRIYGHASKGAYEDPLPKSRLEGYTQACSRLDYPTPKAQIQCPSCPPKPPNARQTGLGPF